MDLGFLSKSSNTHIKVCGLTRKSDVLQATRQGVGAIGLVLYEPSARNLSVEDAVELRNELPETVTAVAVVVDPDDHLLSRIVNEVKPDVIQFHGNEAPQRCREAGLPFFKTIRVQNSQSITEALDQYSEASALLLDTFDPNKVGGTGKTFVWDLVPSISKPLIVAGGLNKDNVGRAIQSLKPAAVDVSTGVESSPGIKNIKSIMDFVAAVRQADEMRLSAF